MPRGVDYRVPLADVLQAAEQHARGWSLRSIARLHWRRWGYSSPTSALGGLSHAMRTLDLPIRDRIDATILASEMHGHASRDARLPGHPDHAAFLKHRRDVRRRKREASA